MTPTKSYPFAVVNVFATEPLSAATSSCSKKVAVKDKAAVDWAWLDLSGLRSLKFKCGRHTICERTGNENRRA
jgi:hypothetical protein